MKTQLLTSTEDFLLEVDHIFICITAREQATTAFQKLGLCCPDYIIQNVEQGTASNLVFFQNAYLELIWIEDVNIFEQHPIEISINIAARAFWQQTGASPFGVCLRCKPNLPNLENPHPFIFFTADNLSRTVEPACFFLPDLLTFTNQLASTSIIHKQLTSHPLGIKKLTDVMITVVSDEELSSTLNTLSTNGAVTVVRGRFPLLELTFDQGVKGKVLDVRPVLPIRLKY